MRKILLAGWANNGLVDPCVAVDDTEKPCRMFCRFGGAEEQIAAGLQGIIEGRDNLPLQLSFQINEKVAAGNEMQLGERRVLEKAMGCEEHHDQDRQVSGL